jgi:Skp family chaperone for outer membrane proteins
MKPFLIAVSAALVGSISSLAVVGQAQPAKAPSAVAFVSANRLLNETTHGRSEASRLQAAQQQRAADLRSKQQALEAIRQQVVAAGDAATRTELQQKETQQRTELERATQQAQLDLQNLQRDINADLQQRLKTVLNDLMKTQPYRLVVNSDTSVMWGEPELDLTSAVVARMNGQQ